MKRTTSGRSSPDLYGEAATFQLEGYLKPHLKAEAVATLGLDPADDPASWSASRGVSRARSSRRIRIGYSVGRYEGDALVIGTTHIAANLAPWGFGFPIPFPFDGRHSDQLRAVERYARSEDGERLLMSVTLTDPWALREPVTLKKVWAWAPGQEIPPTKTASGRPSFSAEQAHHDAPSEDCLLLDVDSHPSGPASESVCGTDCGETQPS